jgi:hypothetical protein
VSSRLRRARDARVVRSRAIEDAEYDAAIFTLDAAARRLAQDPKRGRDLSLAYLYLGVAYIGKGHEAAARARFREALQQGGDLTLSPEKFPPKVINVFESARDEMRAASGAPAPTPPPKKGGSGKLILIGALAVGGGAAALAAGGGGNSAGSSSGGSTSAPSDTRTTLQFSGTVASQEQKGYTFTASKAGVAEVKLSWQDTQLQLRIDCQEEAPPYTGCDGQFNRTTNTTAVYTTNVQQKQYLILVSNFSSRAGAEPFMVQILHP